MSLHQCLCGYHVTLKPADTGSVYEAEFRDTATGEEISRCPVCESGLYRSLVAGVLREVACAPATSKESD